MTVGRGGTGTLKIAATRRAPGSIQREPAMVDVSQILAERGP